MDVSQDTNLRRPKRGIVLSFRVDPDLKRAIEQAAVTEDRSVSLWVIRALQRAVEDEKR